MTCSKRHCRLVNKHKHKTAQTDQQPQHHPNYVILTVTVMTKYISVSADAGRPGLVETACGHTVADKYFSSTCDTGHLIRQKCAYLCRVMFSISPVKNENHRLSHLFYFWLFWIHHWQNFSHQKKRGKDSSRHLSYHHPYTCSYSQWMGQWPHVEDRG